VTYHAADILAKYLSQLNETSCNGKYVLTGNRLLAHAALVWPAGQWP